jgi:parallel beta-helix repeat protein
VSNNVIHQATGAGVLLLGFDAQVLTNEVTGTRFEPADSFGDGIAFGQGATVTVTGNTLTANERNGIVFLDGAGGEISGNEATGNAGWGILEFCTGAPSDVVVGDNVLDGNTLGTVSLCGG